MKCCDSGLLRRKRAGKMLYEYVDDLYDNWTNYKRGGVSINLRNNTAIGATIKTVPSNDQLDKIYEMRAGGWSITID